MAGRLEGKVAVVTGGGNGIGRACCVRFAEEGAHVVVADLLEDAAAETVSLVKERGREALAFRLDAASEADNEALMDAAVERFGRLDALVTAAGISHATYRSGDFDEQRQRYEDMIARFGEPAAGLLNLQLDEWRTVLDVNLTGTMLAVRAGVRRMLEGDRGGAIVTLASIAAKRPDAGPYAYAASKAAVWMFTKGTARELAPLGVRVNAIGPGFIATNMTAVINEMDAIRDLVLTQVPMGRVGEAVEVANTALFLVSDEASYVTGEIIHPDGGFYTE